MNRFSWSWLKLKLVRSFSKGGASQIGWLAGFDALIIGLIFLISTFLGKIKIQGGAYSSGLTPEDELGDRVFSVVNMLLDPGHATELEESTNRWWVLAFTVIGMVFFSGLLISVICNFVERRVERYRSGYNSFKLKNHIIIIGYSDLVISLIRTLKEKDKNNDKYILVQTMQPVEEVQRTLFANFDKNTEKRIIVRHGEQDIIEDIKQLSLPYADEVFVIGDKGMEAHDSTNIACIKLVCEVLKNRTGSVDKMPCTVLFDNLSTFTPFQSNDIASGWRTLIDFRPLNICDEWAKRVVVDSCYYDEKGKVELPKLDREPITYSSDKYVHLVVVGMNKTGIALGVQAAHSMHFPNFIRDNSKKTRITFIDPNVDEEMNFFMGRYAGYFDISTYYYNDLSGKGDVPVRPALPENYRQTDFLDVEFRFVKGTIEANEVRRLVENWADDSEQQLTVAVCLQEQSKAFAASLYLPEVVYRKGITVFVNQESADLITAFNGIDPEKYKKYSNVYPFGMLRNCYRLNNDYVELAKMCNYAFCNMDKCKLEQIDFSQNEEINKKWGDLSQSHKWSNLYLAMAFDIKMRSVGKSIENLTEEELLLMAQVEHNRWNMEKLLLGYRCPTLDDWKEISVCEANYKKYKNEYYVHACIVPFDALSSEDKEKDYCSNDAVRYGRKYLNTIK